MANWKYTLDFKEDWKLAQEEEISYEELIRRMIPKMKALEVYAPDSEDGDPDFESIVEEFEDLLESRDAYSTDEYIKEIDYLYDALCDWGDIQIGPTWLDKMCWISTVI